MVAMPPLDLINIRIDSVPRGADVFGPKGKVGTTPYLAARVKNGEAKSSWRVEKAGFKTKTVESALGVDVDELVQLTPSTLTVVPQPKPTVVATPTVKMVKPKVKPTKPRPKVTSTKAVVKTPEKPPTKPAVVKKKKDPFAGGAGDTKTGGF